MRGLRWLIALVGALLLAAPELSFAQEPKIDAQKLAHRFMLGRYRMPVTCTRADGGLLQLEEAVVFRPADDSSGFPAIRATFFGIEAPEAVRCYNLVHPKLENRRGSVFLSLEAHFRPDLGMRDFRQMLQRGPLEFRIVSGELALREIGTADAAPRKIDFNHRGAKLLIDAVRELSDEDKLLVASRPDLSSTGRTPRRFNLSIHGPGDFSLVGSYVEDPRRWK